MSDTGADIVLLDLMQPGVTRSVEGLAALIQGIFKRLDAIDEELQDLRMVVTQPTGSVRFLDVTQIRDAVGEDISE